MEHRPLTTEQLWEELEARRERREVWARVLVLASPFVVALAIHLAW